MADRKDECGEKVLLGLAPTRRNIFSAPAAVEYANLTRKRLRELEVEAAALTPAFSLQTGQCVIPIMTMVSIFFNLA